MAKIALISEQISPSLIHWAEGLRQQRHEVRIISSRKISWNGTTEVSLQFYFDKWSVFEATRLIPSLMRDLPDVFHFVFQHEDDSASAAHWSLMLFAQSLRRPVVSSLLTSPGDHWKWNPFLRWSDGVSFETRESLMKAKRGGLLSHRQKTEVLLPIVSPPRATPITTLNHLTSVLGKYILIAGPPDHEKLDLLAESLIGSDLYPVFWGPRGHHSHPLKYTALSEEEGPQILDSLIANSQGVLLCLHEFAPSELLRWKALSLRHKIPVWVRQDQEEALPGLCWNGKTGLIVSTGGMELRRALQNSRPVWNFADQDLQSFPLEMTDQSLNILSRLYAHLT